MAGAEIAVVIPTRDRPGRLVRCLAAIGAQTGCGEPEVVVVDDGSRDGDRVAQAVERVGAHLVRLEGRGPAAARNAGASEARAPIVCFTDDDCEPCREWAAKLGEAITAGAAAAAGPTFNARASDAYGAATQAVADSLVEYSRLDGGHVGFAPTSNLACCRDSLLELPFDERYRTYGEDRDWCARLRATGQTIRWVPGATVVHHQDLDLAGFLRKHARYGRGAHRFRTGHPAARGLDPAFYSGLATRASRDGALTVALTVVAQGATALGFLSEAISSRA